MKISENKGNAAVIVVVIFIAGIVMFIFPLMTIAEKKDDTTQLEAQKIVTEYVNKWRTTAYVTQEDWDNLQLSLGATGRAYRVEATVQILDENSAKKSGGLKAGDSSYYTMYTTQIENQLPLDLKDGDIIYLEATTTDESIYDQLKGWAGRITGQNSRNVKDGGMVTGAAK